MWLLSFLVCGILVAVDQFTKYLALTRLKPVGSMTVIQGFLDFTFVENRGAAFGMLSGKRWFFVILTIVIAIVILIAFYKMPKRKEYGWVRVCLVLLLSGAIGNLIDRIRNGFVVDFLELTFISWPVFNLADIYVVIGALFLAYLMIFVIKEEKEK